MDYRQFNVTLKEAGGLDCRKKLSIKISVYAVSIVGSLPSKQRTCIATYSGKNPMWGPRSSMRFYVEDFKLRYNHLLLMVQIMRKQVFGGDKVIEEVCVPLNELFDNCGCVSVTNYSFQRIMKPSGGSKRRFGYVIFTYEFSNIIRGILRSDYENLAMDYSLMRSHSRVTPSAPCIESFIL